MAIPLTVNEINKDWLNSILTEAGFPEKKIDDVQTDVIGEGSGFMGEVIRLAAWFGGRTDLRNVLEQTPWIIPLELSIKLSQLVFRAAMQGYLEANREQLSERDIMVREWLNENGILLMAADFSE